MFRLLLQLIKYINILKELRIYLIIIKLFHSQVEKLYLQKIEKNNINLLL
jgi:hypothetical protein